MTSALTRQVRYRVSHAAAVILPGLLACTFACSSENDLSRGVRPGIETLATDSVGILEGRRVGLITNHTGVSRAGTPGSVLLMDAGIEVVALLAPEHGIGGRVGPGDEVQDEIDAMSGLPVYSLYGERLVPDSVVLQDLEALVFDIQDIGARYYTYVSTMVGAMRAAAEFGLLFVVADRPNPIGGDLVQGNVLDPGHASFVGLFPVAMRHGMSTGELAMMFNREFEIGADLRVVLAAGWRRSQWAEETGVPWIPTSPNMPDLESASHYPGTCLFEGTNLSVGRGTDRPFQQIGAPWLDVEAVLSRLSDEGRRGVQLTPVTFTPTGADDGKFEGTPARGIRLEVTNREVYDPTTTAVALLVEIRKSAGAEWAWRGAAFDRLAGTDRLRVAIDNGATADSIVASWAAERDRFETIRAGYLLYR